MKVEPEVPTTFDDDVKISAEYLNTHPAFGSSLQHQGDPKGGGSGDAVIFIEGSDGKKASTDRKVCPVCLKSITSKNYARHRRIHAAASFQNMNGPLWESSVMPYQPQQPDGNVLLPFE